MQVARLEAIGVPHADGVAARARVGRRRHGAVGHRPHRGANGGAVVHAVVVLLVLEHRVEARAEPAGDVGVFQGALEERLARAGAILLEVGGLAIRHRVAEHPLLAHQAALVRGRQHLAVAQHPPLGDELLHQGPGPVALARVPVEVDVPGEHVRQHHADARILTGRQRRLVERGADLQRHQGDLLLDLDGALAADVLLAVAAHLPLVHRALPVVEEVQLPVAQHQPELVPHAGFAEVEHALQRGDDGLHLCVRQRRVVQGLGERLPGLDAAVPHFVAGGRGGKRRGHEGHQAEQGGKSHGYRIVEEARAHSQILAGKFPALACQPTAGAWSLPLTLEALVLLPRRLGPGQETGQLLLLGGQWLLRRALPVRGAHGAALGRGVGQAHGGRLRRQARPTGPSALDAHLGPGFVRRVLQRIKHQPRAQIAQEAHHQRPQDLLEEDALGVMEDADLDELRALTVQAEAQKALVPLVLQRQRTVLFASELQGDGGPLLSRHAFQHELWQLQPEGQHLHCLDACAHPFRRSGRWAPPGGHYRSTFFSEWF
ncbi:hypothetical protein STIAU_7877 [Stigmatella aurantiaca DW4/3-1]|uniref:Uncharacterized protein n=1 Tax=Stigmatella aurantiaca (strain DW4/3-1) TaxID=378806 RepID=Q092I2_STIAD|nr:hypothetical protein STIAU_7877 [Stigmatella aurantiaca DW4/3-1]